MLVLAVFLFILPISNRKSKLDNYPPDSENGKSELTINEVIDGDTFVLSDASRVRLIGVDTPEKGQPYYREATLFAESLLTGAVIRIEYDEEPYDDYGRRLVYLFADSIFYNELIIEQGMASVYLFPHNRKFAETLITAQKSSRRNKAGIWSLPDSSPEEYYVSVSGSFRFHRPLCPHLKKARPENLRRIGKRGDALDLGLSSCRFCRP